MYIITDFQDMTNLNKQIANLQVFSKGGAHSQVMVSYLSFSFLFF